MLRCQNPQPFFCFNFCCLISSKQIVRNFVDVFTVATVCLGFSLLACLEKVCKEGDLQHTIQLHTDREKFCVFFHSLWSKVTKIADFYIFDRQIFIKYTMNLMQIIQMKWKTTILREFFLLIFFLEPHYSPNTSEWNTYLISSEHSYYISFYCKRFHSERMSSICNAALRYACDWRFISH